MQTSLTVNHVHSVLFTFGPHPSCVLARKSNSWKKASALLDSTDRAGSVDLSRQSSESKHDRSFRKRARDARKWVKRFAAARSVTKNNWNGVRERIHTERERERERERESSLRARVSYERCTRPVRSGNLSTLYILGYVLPNDFSISVSDAFLFAPR